MMAEIKYQIADYKGTIYVHCNENDDDESLIARAKQGLKRRCGFLPIGYESWKVVSRT